MGDTPVQRVAIGLIRLYASGLPSVGQKGREADLVDARSPMVPEPRGHPEALPGDNACAVGDTLELESQAAGGHLLDICDPPGQVRIDGPLSLIARALARQARSR